MLRPIVLELPLNSDHLLQITLSNVRNITSRVHGLNAITIVIYV